MNLLAFPSFGASMRKKILLSLVALGALVASPSIQAQCVSLTTLGSPATQNFDGLSNVVATGVAWTDNSTVPGAYSTRTTYNVATGSSNAGALYSFGVAGTNPVTDRALGGIASGGTGTFFWAMCYTNNTGATIGSLNISYNGEQWRDGGAATPVAQSIVFQHQVANAGVISDADTPTTGWTAFAGLDFTSPTFTNTGAGALLDGNLAANRTAKSGTVTTAVAVGQQFWIRWQDINDGGNDHGLAIDDLSVTPNGVVGTTLNISDVTLAEGNPPGTTTFTFAVTLTAPAGAGGVTFDIATADGTAQDDNPVTEDNDYVAQSLTGQNIPAGSTGPYNFNVTVNRDTAAELNETFFVNVTNITGIGASIGDGQGLGTINNDDVSIVFIHDVQGNGAATPIPGSTVTVEGIVIGDYQGSSELQGFFLEEEDTDHDADPATSEGIFVFCTTCPTAVAEGQRVQVTGSVSEFFNATEITASTAGSVVVTNAGNNIGLVTPAPIDLPVVGVINDFYEAREGMRVTFVDSLSVSEYFEMARYGQIELFEGGRPRQFTEANAPSVAGFATHIDNLNRRRVILDDTNNIQNVSNPPSQVDGVQFIFHPRANGGLSVGTQGTDFFRGGDLVNGLTGVLDWSFAGLTGTDAWRIRPTATTPATFTTTNPRPATPPAVGGAIKAASMNLLNYFTTIDTTASTSSGPCGPGGTLDCRGADSNAELIRQRERTSIVICTLNADVYGFNELENTTASATITDLLGAVNTRCGGAHPYTFVNTGGTLGTDAIRVQLIYRTGILSPVGSPLSDLDPVHNRPPTAQTFDVVDATNPAFGKRFTVVANHFKSKGCPGTGGDADANDGQSCFNGTRVAQATRLLTWLNSTVIPAAGDPDVLLLGDFNSNAQENPVTTILGGGYTDLETFFLGANAYSYVFDGQIGHLDYAFASTSLLSQVTGSDAWHINADENPLFDYSDEIKDVGESAFEEKPDGSALVPPRVVFQPATPWRASDHDPVVVGLFQIAELAITKTDSPDPVIAGNNLTYTITVTNNGPDAASTASWTDTLPAGTSFVSLPAVAGWSCTTPAVGSGGTVTCSNPTFAVGSAVFTLTVNVAPTTAVGTVLSNTATTTSAAGDGNTANNSATATTTVATSADLSTTKTDTPDPVTAGNNITYTITVTNAGPSNAATVALADTLPAGTTFVSLASPGGWSCTTPAVGAGGAVNCSIATLPAGSAVFTLVVNVDSGVAGGTVLTNTATASSATTDPNPGNESGVATTTVGASADLSVTKTDAPDPVVAGTNITYTITVTNAGPSTASTVALADTLPAGTTFVSLSSPGGWSCTTPAVGAGGTVNCSVAALGVGSAVFTLVVQVDGSTATSTVISNTATVSAATTDAAPGNNSATSTTTVGSGSADLSITKVDTPDPVTAGTNLTYTITATNAGPSAATTATVSDTLPAGTTFVSLASPGGWSCTTPAVGAGGTVSCSNPSFAPGSAVFTLTVAVTPSVTTGTVISNTATASAATTDPAPGNNSATATSTVAASADLSITKTDAPDPVLTGGNLVYSIGVSNAGPSDAASASWTDTLPTGTTFVSLPAVAGWSCTTPAVGAGGTVTCNAATFAALATSNFTLTVAVAGSVADGTVLSNTATVSTATTDPGAANNSATATTTVNAVALLAGTKSASGAPYNPGSTITYTIVLRNNGGATQGDNPGDEFTDVLPVELILVSATATSGTPVANTGTNTVTWNGSLAAGATVTITIQATIAPGLANGTPITNQGTISYDGNDDGVNEASAATDDPSTGTAGDPTAIVVGQQSAIEVPTLGDFGLVALTGLLALGGARSMRRRRR
jgi:uncharacterized repeat protein (TIGR01451 family)